jgi:hypothetical protein
LSRMSLRALLLLPPSVSSLKACHCECTFP